MLTITLRLRLHRPTQAKIRRYRELVERTTAFANNLVAAGRPKDSPAGRRGRTSPATFRRP
ncbi:hypothetical protein AB1398_13860 [Hydrogenibacillus schlegelii]